MFEKVNPSHPDKLADRIAGAIVDLAYAKNERPKIAVEVLLGHGVANVMIESSESFEEKEIKPIVDRIAGEMELRLVAVPQDVHLANNQQEEYRCGDNGIFKGLPLTQEEKLLSQIARIIYEEYPYDGKYIIDGKKLVVCQSNAKTSDIELLLSKHGYHNDFDKIVINPLGDWTGGTDVDAGATNRKLGSDMAFAVTGGGLHGKTLCKADVSLNIYAHLLAQELNEEIQLSCAIGDKYIAGLEYGEIVEIAHDYIKELGGFEKFAEWGLVR